MVVRHCGHWVSHLAHYYGDPSRGLQCEGVSLEVAALRQIRVRRA